MAKYKLHSIIKILGSPEQIVDGMLVDPTPIIYFGEYCDLQLYYDTYDFNNRKIIRTLTYKPRSWNEN